jgi:hypothetical protein
MRLGSSPLLKVAFLATALIFAAVAVYIFGFRFFAWLESDATVPVLLAAKALHAKSLVVSDWYYANGDLWVLAPHLFAILPVAILGAGPPALLVGNLMGFALELFVLVKVYRRYCDASWIAWFAAIATLAAWSKSHIAYEYIQLSYGLSTVLYIVTFHMFARLGTDETIRRGRWVAIGLFIAVITINNPTRSLVFLFAPLLVGIAWPWRGFAMRRRLSLAAVATMGWAIGWAGYTYWLSPFVAWSSPRGHVGFVIGGLKQIEANLSMFGRGIVILCAGGGGFETAVKSGVWIPGALILVGALALVTREALSREWTPLRWMSVVVVGQFGIVLGPLLIGNVLDYPEASRYLMASLVSLVGLAVILAVRTYADKVGVWWRRLAIAWLVAVPVGALVAVPDVAPPSPVIRMWPDAPELQKIADELVRRHLTHGFAERLSANVLTLDSGGKALTCRTTMYDVLMPQRWLASTSCYDPATFPDRFFVVSYQDEFELGTLHATLPTELESFHVGDTYEVHVYRTKDVPLNWLDLPIPGGDLARFPIWISAIHPQLMHGNVELQGSALVATGTKGIVVYGPYIDLPKGKYVATWMGNGVESTGELTFRVTSGFGRRKLAKPITLDASTIPRGRHAVVRIPFTLKRPIDNVDFRVFSAGGGRVSLHELMIERAY